MTMERKYLGVTPPISEAESSVREKEVTVSLMDELRRQNTFEGEEEARTREIVLGRVAALVKKFVKTVSLARGMSEQAATAAGGKIFTFGSYRLGVHGPGTDIDTLCVVPKHVSREDFHDIFEPLLRECEGVTEVSGVPEAFVPVIKSKISGIPLDFLMARLALAQIPDDLSLQDDNLLRNLDERDVDLDLGSRVTDEILRLVPNVQVFRDSLRCIKLWAQRRAIYSNVNGFLGGVAWGMLVARICQLYPNAVAGAIVSRFFIIMYQWTWPQPVLLKQIEDGPLQVRVWNPRLYPGDRAHRMPIITPAYPSMCSTHNVTASNQTIMTEEFKRGADIVDRVIVGSTNWSELFAKHDFFHRYRYYLQVIASTEDEGLQIKWSGTVESKIRQLVIKLEFVDSLILAHPFTKGFDQVAHCVSEEEVRAVAQGDTTEIIAKRRKEDVEGVEGATSVYSTTFYIGLLIEPKQAGAVGPRRLDISYPTTEFTKMVKMWEKYDEATMGIVVRYIKSAALPDYVFDPGERQPKQALKRGKNTGKSGNTPPDQPNKKRRSSQSTTDVHSVSSSAASSSGRSMDAIINAAGPLQPATPHTSQVSPASVSASLLPVTTSTSVSPPAPTPPANGAALFSGIREDLKSPQLPFGENVKVATRLEPTMTVTNTTRTMMPKTEGTKPKLSRTRAKRGLASRLAREAKKNLKNEVDEDTIDLSQLYAP